MPQLRLIEPHNTPPVPHFSQDEVQAMLEAYATKHGAPLVDVLCSAIVSYAGRERKAVRPWPRILVRGGKP